MWCRMQEVNQQWFQSEFIKANVNKVSQLLNGLYFACILSVCSHIAGAACVGFHALQLVMAMV